MARWPLATTLLTFALLGASLDLGGAQAWTGGASGAFTAEVGEFEEPNPDDVVVEDALRLEPSLLIVGDPSGTAPVTAWVSLSAPYRAADVVADSMRICFMARCAPAAGRPQAVGPTQLRASFAREAVVSLLDGAEGAVTLAVKGRLAGPSLTFFGGADTIVVRRAVARLAIRGLSDVAAGTVQMVTVTAVDTAGRVVTGYDGSVRITSTDPHGDVGSSIRLRDGRASFEAVLKTAGPQTVRAVDAGTPSVGAAAVTVVVRPGAPHHLVVTPATARVPVGTAQRFQVEARDAFENRLGDVTSQAVFTITPDARCTGSACSGSNAGTHTVRATAGARTGTATLDVVAGRGG